MSNNSFSSRIQDVGNEKLNFIGPIDNLFEIDTVTFGESIQFLHSSNPNLYKHATFSKLFAEDILKQDGNKKNDKNGLNEGEIAAINLYTREWDLSIYRFLNIALRKEDRNELKGWFPIVRLLVSGLLKIDKFKGSLWRGIKDVDHNPRYTKGNKFFWWGFSSCSKQLDVLCSPNFLGDIGKRILFRIECTNGVDIQKYSNIPNEVEILLLPGSYFEVIGELNVGNDLTIVDLKQIEPPVPIFDLPKEKCKVTDKPIEVSQEFLNWKSRWLHDGATPLHNACYNGHKPVVEILLSNGANINAPEENGATPLYIACQEGHKPVVEILLSNGANINAPDEDGATPLYIACLIGHKPVVEILLSNGANINAPDENDGTPLHVACLNGQKPVVEILLSNKANINAPTKDGASPLYFACQEGHKPVVEILLSNLANIEGYEIQIASQMGHAEIVELLSSKKTGANACLVQ